jgi:hypothetical protein
MYSTHTKEDIVKTGLRLLAIKIGERLFVKETKLSKKDIYFLVVFLPARNVIQGLLQGL